MTNTNGESNEPRITAAPESSSSDASGTHGHASRIPEQESVLQTNSPQPATPAPKAVDVLDDTLEEMDLKLSIKVSLHGRTQKIIDAAFTKVAYDGLENGQRGMLFSSIKNFLLEEVYQAVATRVNRKAPVTVAKKADLGDKQYGKPLSQSEPIPPYTGTEEEAEIPPLHIPPPLDQELSD